jgi:hypothetical protein
LATKLKKKLVSLKHFVSSDTKFVFRATRPLTNSIFRDFLLFVASARIQTGVAPLVAGLTCKTGPDRTTTRQLAVVELKSKKEQFLYTHDKERSLKVLGQILPL